MQLAHKSFVVLFALTVVVLLVVGGFVLLSGKNADEKVGSTQPIKVVTAKEFINIKDNSLKKLQSEGYGSWDSSGLLIVDLRDNKSFEEEHIKGSGHYDADKVLKNIGFTKGVDLVLVVNKNEVQKAKDIAEKMANIREKYKSELRVQGEKIYVISDGYEGLKATNLQMEKGGLD